ncbi:MULTISPECIES: ferredoxin [Streptomyces]|uniref:Ferredoxin n=1 Tax=Streptomyces botrytidirepellens TaxID=2486417 RepID=A0A3M8T6J8_9ACTN|nr:ferredoxin [Streptomyces botrytidirepellens]RNF87154.1 ferredoxin [Streptomyces botrytidirepellens]
MRVEVDRDRCRGAGQCTLRAPELFDQSEDDGMVIVLDDRPPPALHEKARLAARLCPNGVIRLVCDGPDEG